MMSTNDQSVRLGDRIKALLPVALLLVSLTACVQHTWAPGPGATAPFNVASGRCKLVAMGAQRDVVAWGSSSYVAGAMIGGAIGNAVRSQNTFNACMEAEGFVTVDAQQ